MPVIAILRGCPERHALSVARALIDTGITVIEVTMDSERPLRQICVLREAFPAAEFGVGSVRKASEVREAVDAGAQFVVSPVINEGVITTAIDHGVAALPGASTPTEIDTALRIGATAVKVFPARHLGGPEYISALLRPLGTPPLVPTGEVATQSVNAYIHAGAIAVGLGGSLLPREALAGGDVQRIAELASAMVSGIEL